MTPLSGSLTISKAAFQTIQQEDSFHAIRLI